MTGRVYLRAVVPIGLLYSGSLVCSNLVYLYLSVAFIQMLKAAAPVAVLFTSWVWGVANPSVGALGNILIIVFGVGLASFGEIEFSWLGFLFQLGGIIFEAMRLVMIQVMLSDDGQKMDPLVSLYYYAPVCAVMNFFVAWASEFSSFQWDDLSRTGMGVLLLNASVAFMLNVSSVFLVGSTSTNACFAFPSFLSFPYVSSEFFSEFLLILVQIGKTSGLVMTLTGILKNILLVVASVIIWHTSVTFLQFLGYTIALGGMVYYTLGWEQIKTQSGAVVNWTKAQWSSPSLDESRLSPLVRRAIFLGLLVLITIMALLGFMHDGSSSTLPSTGSGADSSDAGGSWLAHFGIGSGR
jgi:hypothetical protein